MLSLYVGNVGSCFGESKMRLCRFLHFSFSLKFLLCACREMGFISRKIFPACGSMCVCCPALRSRSRQPVKRYKKLLSEIFPKSPVSIHSFLFYWLITFGNGVDDETADANFIYI